MANLNIVHTIPVLVLLGLLAHGFSAARDCVLSDGQVYYRPSHDSDVDQVQLIGVSTLDKDRAGWFDLKRCLNSLKEIKSSEAYTGNLAVQPIVNNAITAVSNNMKRYRAESKTLIAAVLYKVFCGGNVDLNNAQHLIETTNRDPRIPHIFKDSFNKGV